MSEKAGGRNHKYGLGQMEVGDSFFLSCAEGNYKRDSERINGGVAYHKKRGRKFIRRKEEGGVRIWRTE